MDLNKYLNETAAPETQYSKEEYAAMKKSRARSGLGAGGCPHG